MYRNTRFGEVLKGLSRGMVEKAVKNLDADKYSKSFGSWDQLVAMIYAQLSGSQSLREVEAGFNSQSAHHYHLGTKAIKRSTLADANASRSCNVFEAICHQLLQLTHRGMKREMTELLYLIDSSPIPLKGLGYEKWTQGNSSNRTQGLKLHMILAPDIAAPVFMTTTAPNVNDITVGQQLKLESNATYVFDKGYYDFNWWYKIHCHNSVFVTRFKKNVGVNVVESLRDPDAVKGDVIEDQRVLLKNRRPGGHRINNYHGTALRRIVIDRPGKEKPLILATNDFERSAEEIAALYKKRWDIELFFKWLKQNLKIKKFLGRSENAVKIQLYTAIISYLLMAIYRRKKGLKQTLQLCLVAVRSGLFQRPEIEETAYRKRRKQQAECQRMQGVLAI